MSISPIPAPSAACSLKVPRDAMGLSTPKLYLPRPKTSSFSSPSASTLATRPTSRVNCNGRSMVKDRKSTRLNSSHVASSYAVYCSEKKKGIKIYVQDYRLVGASLWHEGLACAHARSGSERHVCKQALKKHLKYIHPNQRT